MIANLGLLVKTVLAGSSHPTSTLHGESHWKCVAQTGLQLASHVDDADALVVFLFGLLHDCKRLDDGHDPQHGPRAAAYATTLNGKLFELSPLRLALLTRACHDHTHGKTTADPTVGVCFDADRLNLCRLGVRIDPKFLSTEIARRGEVIRAAEQLAGQRMSWEAIYAGVIDGRDSPRRKNNWSAEAEPT